MLDETIAIIWFSDQMRKQEQILNKPFGPQAQEILLVSAPQN